MCEYANMRMCEYADVRMCEGSAYLSILETFGCIAASC
jgi:hypothetical protein